MYFLLLPFLPSILAFCPPALFPWLLHSLQLGQDRNFPVAVETQMKDTLQTKMPNKKWLCVSPDGRFSLPGCGGFEALLWGTLYGQGGLLGTGKGWEGSLTAPKVRVKLRAEAGGHWRIHSKGVHHPWDAALQPLGFWHPC